MRTRLLCILGILYCSFANATVESVPTIAQLKMLSPAEAASTTTIVQGYHSAGDGGGGIFYYSPSDSSSPNDGTIISPSTSVKEGRWMRVSGGDDLNVRFFGAYGDGNHDDTRAIQAAIDATPDGGELRFPSGRFLVSGVRVGRPIALVGDAVSKWDGHGAELVARGDQRYVLAFMYESDSASSVMKGGEIAHLGINGGGHKMSDGIFVGEGFSEVTIRSLRIGSGLGNGVYLRHWFEGKFDDVFFDRIDARSADAVVAIGPVVGTNIATNVNNLRIYNSRFESNAGPYIKSDVNSNFDIFVLANTKFEWTAPQLRGAKPGPLFDLNQTARGLIYGNSFTQFRASNGYSPLFRIGGGAAAGTPKRGTAISFFHNDFAGVDENTVLVDASDGGFYQWQSNTMIDSKMPKNQFLGNQKQKLDSNAALVDAIPRGLFH